MSLFKAREWWRTNCGHDEEFDQGCLAIANLDNDPNGDAKVACGSLNGCLRIFYPRDRDFRVEDLLLEQTFEEPILQIEAGNLTSNGGTSMVILHPKKLVVYTLQAVGNQQNQASYYQLHKNYEHKLERTCANMVIGPFGNHNNADYICTQSMDGQLTVFEHESVAFSRFLHHFTLPGPLCYVAKIDSFVTCNSSFEIECYKYQVLASSTEEKTEAGGAGLTQQKKVQVDWSFVLGEAALDIRVGRYSRTSTNVQIDILVLGEHVLFALSEIGACRMQIRLDFVPTCLSLYQNMEEDTGGAIHNAVIGSSTGALLVYKDAQLVWAAKADMVPVTMQVSAFGPLRGLMCCIDEQGLLCITYMGTDPPLNVVGGFEGKELNYEEMDEEHRRLLGIIREATSENKAEPSDKVVLRAQVPSQLDSRPESGPGEDYAHEGARDKRRSVTLRVFVTYSGAGSVDDMQLSIHVPPPLAASNTLFTIPSLRGSARTPVIVAVTLYAGSACLPPSNLVRITGSYTTSTGEPRSCRTELMLPLALFCQVVPPVKNAGYKITLDTTRMPPQLTTLFEDLVSTSALANDANQRSAANNVLSFMYYSGHDVTILVSKNAGRYRLQSGSFEALWLVADELCRRLKVYFGNTSSGKEEPFAISFQETLPLQDFFVLIDKHFEARNSYVKKGERLAERAHQFRSIQKRLLVRFKDRNPAPLQHLDVLLEGTFQQLNQLGEEIQASQAELKAAADMLSCGCQLILLLMRYRFALDEESFELLQSYLTTDVNDGADQGWEECVEAAMTHLLRTTLSKSTKDAVNVSTQLVPLTDTTKLKKQISVVCERLARGATLSKEK
mmetsp:Transcript_47681/g.91053  ORF Transcript_47681/g.91053 Transcript_47681/m.91053 type:complete len:841 (+) Transcript_47681:257-2779(+)|eukprot:CAMPEP_0114241314 /NCGR_PEP_ID=MMETSP0058-20121206/9567_1 /TAXON_ID=36894 /ORGANISM="Pyramimonas parkeae, CCMP726" /LENGTH=840 /DNA_ID=CAMNT_0001353833 /DNA_START=184 /DNA_END=2706 /DNA_ORIENTATION=+